MKRTACRFQSIAAAVACLALLILIDTADAQRRGGWGRDNGMSMLSSKKVQEELELVPDQIEQLEQVNEEQREAMREMFMGMRDRFRDVSREEREDAMQEIREKMTELNEKFTAQAKEALLPHQVDRWKQLQFQMKAQQAGGADRLLADNDMAEELNITEEQLAALKEKATKVRESMQKKIETIRNEARDELLSVLTPEQQEKYRSLMGDSFTFEQQRGRGNFGRGDQGGRGGRGGRAGRGGEGGRRGEGRGDRRTDAN
jgi:Spy/CpxP family protein refolding chaperone